MDDLRKILNDLNTRLAKLEKGLVIKNITIPSDGYLVVQKLSADPATPIEGQVWENTTTHVLKVYLNGTIKTISAS